MGGGGLARAAEIQIGVAPHLARKDIAFEAAGAKAVEPARNRVLLRDGRALEYDYLVIATGPRLAFDEIPGLGPDGGFTHSVCTTDHATSAWQAYQAFLQSPGRSWSVPHPAQAASGPRTSSR